MASNPEQEPVYIDKRVWDFLRAWPDNLNPEIYDWLFEARVIATPRDQIGDKSIWRTGPCLTNLGYPFKEMIDSQSFNFFTVDQLLALWPVELLAMRRDDCTEFLRILQVDWNAPDVRRYIARGLDKDKAVTGTREVDPALSRVTLRLTLNDSGSPKSASLLTRLFDLEIALFHLQAAIGSYFHVE